MTSSRLKALIFAAAATLTVSTALAPHAQAPPQWEADLKALIAKNPSDLAPYRELATKHLSAGRRDEAEKVLRQALTAHRDSSAVYEAIANIALRPSPPTSPPDPDKLIAIGQEWSQVDSTNPRPLLLAAQGHQLKAALAKDRPEEAAAHFDEALKAVDDAVRLQPGDREAGATKVGILRFRAQFTTDPAERERLMKELEAAQQKMATAAGVRSIAEPLSQAQPSAGFPAHPNAVRVGGNVRAPQKIKDVKPVFPPEAHEARVQGVVIMEVVIDEAGKVVEARTLRSIPLLDQAAIDAVRQWEFTPTLLNGAAVPVIMTVTVQFTLSQGP